MGKVVAGAKDAEDYAVGRLRPAMMRWLFQNLFLDHAFLMSSGVGGSPDDA